MLRVQERGWGSAEVIARENKCDDAFLCTCRLALSLANSEGAIAVPEAVGDAIDLDVVGRRGDVRGQARCRSVDNLLTNGRVAHLPDETGASRRLGKFVLVSKIERVGHLPGT